MAELTEEGRTALVADARSQFAHLAFDYVLGGEVAEEAQRKILACAEIVGSQAKTFSKHALDYLAELRGHVAEARHGD